MRLQMYSQLCSRQFRIYKSLNYPNHFPASYRLFHATTRAQAIKPFLLADIGEGIRECEIIQWFVEPEAFVEEFDKLCEVQSDKASVEITSRFAGVIKKLHYDAGDMAKVGKPLVDIDIQGAIKEDDLEAIAEPNTVEGSKPQVEDKASSESSKTTQNLPSGSEKESKGKGTHATLATPAVRHLTKELNVNIADVDGTGRDGRVLKDDVHQFAKQRGSNPAITSSDTSSISAIRNGPQKETVTQLTNMQLQMFKSMTKSLSIPHFLYADEINFTSLSTLRPRLNKSLSKIPSGEITKLSYLPFVIKAVSMMLQQYPSLNARVDIDSSKPVLVHREQHNIGVAMDTPNGLLVPVLKNVASMSILSIAAQLMHLQTLALAGKLGPSDLSGGTITVSNIGNIGGTTLSPVIIEGQVAILGMGKIRTVPAFDDAGALVKKQVCNFSWSADHRVIDGATMARAAQVVQNLVEQPESMVVQLR